MVVILASEETILRIYRCPACNDVYREGDHLTSCAVLHIPGSCCHFTDKLLSDAQVIKLQEVLEA